MSDRLQFGDHRAFHKHVLRTTLGGAGLALVVYLASAIFSQVSAVSSLYLQSDSRALNIIWMAVIAATLGLAANPPGRKTWPTAGLFAFGIGLLGALLMQALAASPKYTWFGWAVYGLGVGVIAGRDLRDHRRYTVPLATALSLLLATWVEQVFMTRLGLTDHIHPVVAHPLHGALFGFMVSIGLVARQVYFERDVVSQEFQRVRPLLMGEVLELAERAMGTYRRIKDVLRDREDRGTPIEPQLIKGVQGLVLRIVDLGRKWHEVEREASQTSAESLGDRVTELQQKIDSATDRVARQQYTQALQALRAQLGYLRDISRSRERVVARVHNYLTTLERLHLAVLNHRGADAAKFSDELAPMLAEIENIGQEMDFASEAMAELEEVDQPGACDEVAAAEESGEDEAPAAAEPAADDTPAAETPAVAGVEDPEAALAASAFAEPVDDEPPKA